MAVSNLSALWHEINAAQPAAPRWLVLSAASLALATVAYRPSWRVARNAVTIAHEGGHAVAALLTGRKPYGFGMVLTALSGYIAPSLFGLGGAALLGRGHITALLWVCVGLLALMLLMLRNFFGLLSVVVTGALAFVVSWYADPKVQAGFAYLAVWFLLLGGVRPVFELQWQRRGGRAPDSDADQLGKLTKLPAGLWVFLFVVVALGSVVLGGHWLIPTAFHYGTAAAR